MNTDSAFTIGTSHQVCEDYAIAGVKQVHDGPPNSYPDGFSYAIISDGCSSSLNTDIGSRLLAKTCEQLIRSTDQLSIPTIESIHLKASRNALRHARALGLDARCIDATLLTLQASPTVVTAACSGDGVIAFQTVTGLIDVYSISFPMGYPLYPSYLHQPDRLAALPENERVKEIRHYQNTGSNCSLLLQCVYQSHSITETFTRTQNDVRFVAAFTDGIHSFSELIGAPTSKSIKGIPLEQVIPNFLAFKSFKGAFLKRRFKRVREEYHRKGWTNHDDLACGVIDFGEPQVKSEITHITPRQGL